MLPMPQTSVLLQFCLMDMWGPCHIFLPLSPNLTGVAEWNLVDRGCWGIGQGSHSPALLFHLPASPQHHLHTSHEHSYRGKVPPWESQPGATAPGPAAREGSLWLMKPNDKGLRSCPKQEMGKRGGGGQNTSALRKCYKKAKT